VADTIAEVKQISVEAVAEATTENAATLFNLW
jgi:Tat protein secretion system quality control protein TatD with DNase activity